MEEEPMWCLDHPGLGMLWSFLLKSTISNLYHFFLAFMKLFPC
jgi:hypothetical protein